MSGFKLFVIITFNDTKDPIKYAPLSPRKIFGLGKLNNKKVNNVIIWPTIKKENSKLAWFMFI